MVSLAGFSTEPENIRFPASWLWGMQIRVFCKRLAPATPHFYGTEISIAMLSHQIVPLPRLELRLA